MLPQVNAQTYQWAHSEGGWVGDSSNDVVFDQEGNVYTTGYFDAPNFGPFTPHSWPYNGFFLAKYNKTGELLWVKFGTGGTAIGTGLALDSQGGVYVGGSFSYTIDLGDIVLRGEHQFKGFLVKYNTDGDLLWAKVVEERHAGGSGAVRVAIDKEDNLYYSGLFSGQVAFEDGVQLACKHNTSSFHDDVYLIKYNKDGKILWAKFAGTALDDLAMDLEVSADNKLYLALKTGGNSFNFGDNIYDVPRYGSVILSCNSDGQGEWVRGINGEIADIALDELENLYATGNFWSEISLSSDFSLTSDDYGNMFLVKYRADKSVEWANKMESDGHPISHIAVSGRQVYLAGSFTRSLSTNKFERTESQGHHMYVLKLNDVGYEQWIKYDAWPNETAFWNTGIVHALALSREGALAVTGRYNSPSISFDGNTLNNNSGNREEDLFIAVMDDPTSLQCPSATPVLTVNNPIICVTDNATLTASGHNNYSIAWYRNGALLQHTYHPEIEVSEAGEYYFVVYDGSACAQSSNSVQVQLVDEPLKNLILTPGPISCKNEPIRIEAVNDADYSYQWHLNGVPIPDQNQYFIMATESGDYHCLLWNVGICQLESESSSVLLLPNENDFLPDTLYRCRNEILTLTPENLQYQQWNFTWSTDETTSSIEVQEEGIYRLHLNVGDCNFTDHVWVKNHQDFKVPNVITPNGDSWNEHFIIKNLAEPLYLKIYNRWGELVYENSAYNNTWAAEGLPAGVYYYSILDAQGCREKNSLKGWVQVLR